MKHKQIVRSTSYICYQGAGKLILASLVSKDMRGGCRTPGTRTSATNTPQRAPSPLPDKGKAELSIMESINYANFLIYYLTG